jgi:Flp pilus assembly pilin Flp
VKLPWVGRAVRDESGAAMVEFALVVPLLLMILVGIMEFGRAWNLQQVITDAAREGARRAVVRDGDTSTKVGTDEAPGTVPSVVVDRLRRAGLIVAGTGTWSMANYNNDCTGWTPPAAPGDRPMIAGCGWGRETGLEARVVVTTPHPFFLLRPVLRLFGTGSGTGIDPKMLSTNFVMRNE